MSARGFTVGAHNLHDRAGRPTLFAAVLLFTEAMPKTVRAKVRARVQRALYRTIACKRQRDLVIALRRWRFKVEGTGYRLAHGGVAWVTPHRGTFVVLATDRRTGIRYAFVVEHRINAAFPPYVGGEPEFRRERWEKHTQLTIGWINELEADGREVVAGGDLNTPNGVLGYDQVLDEVGHRFDRIGCSDPARLERPKVLGRAGSDHPRIKARLVMPGKR